MNELKTESLENLMASASSGGEGGSPGAPAEPVAVVDSGPTGGGAGGGGTPPAGSPAEVVPGTQLGRYKIIRRLGEGGMSAVFEAVHIDIRKPVAIKVLSNALAQQEEAQVRFLREAAASSRLQHPHVVDVADFGTDNGRSYLVMELMRGEDLSQHIQRKGVLLTEALADIMLPVCAGVQAAHDMKIVHRDLKPQNIFLCKGTMGVLVPKVLDFGISKVVDAEAAALTHSGMMMGTPYYLSPEQIIQNHADARSDQYAMGVILYECATGRRPHEAETLYGILNSITQGSYPRPRALRPEMSEGFETIILRALAQDANRRFATVHALGNALMAFASEKQRVIWSDYFSGATESMELGEPPHFMAPAGKSGSTEILKNDASGSMHNATRILPEAMQSGSGMRKHPSGAVPTGRNLGTQTGRSAFADPDDDAIAAMRRKPKGLIIAGSIGAVALTLGLVFGLSGSKKPEVLAKPAEVAPKVPELARPSQIPPPVAVKPSAPIPEPVVAKPEPAVAAPVASRSRESESSSSGKRRPSRRPHAEARAAVAAPTARPEAPAPVVPPVGKKLGDKSGNVQILD